MTWDIPVHESIAERIAADSAKSLTPPERTYRALWELLNIVYGPGLLAYFDGVTRKEIKLVIQGLIEIGAGGLATVFQESLENLPAGYFDLPARRRNASVSTAIQEQIYKIGGNFQDTGYPKKELEAFVQLHDASFLGPRTKLELWNSMKKRGAATAPKFTVKKFDREREAEKDRAYSTRSCPNCDYPSPDYRPSCKACGFPHGRK